MSIRSRAALALAVAVVLLVPAGVSAPAFAWHYPSKKTAKKIWKVADPGPQCRTPRRGIRISNAVVRRTRWAAVSFTATRCANGELLYTARVGSDRWRYTDSLGSDFGAPGSCSAVADVPNRVVVDLTGLTCRGGRSTPARAGR